MSNNLYIEAVEAAEQLKLAAEDKAKQQIIESMTPHIKSMIEKKLMSEADKSDEGHCEVEESEEESQEECGSMMSSVEEGVYLDDNAKSILTKLVSDSAKKESIAGKINDLREGLKTVKHALILSENVKTSRKTKAKINLLFKNIIKETKNIESSSILKSDKNLLNEIYKLFKELESMSKRRTRKSYMNESLDDLLEMNLFEADDDDDSSVALPDDDEPSKDEQADDSSEKSDDPFAGLEDMSQDDQAVGEDTTVRELAMMAGLLEDDAPQEEADEDLEEALYEMDDAAHEDHYEIADEMVELEEMMELEEDEDEGVQEMMESRRGDRVLEIDENMLRREIGRMKAIREGEAKDMAHHFGGGSLEGEAFVDGVELNKLHEMRNKAAKVVRKNRMLESKLAQYKKALRGMKGQLQEMNLFNAKLLYANKLMQNRDLSIKQQRHVVESLDEAKTLGEAKILFESLSKSLVSSRPRSNSNLNESTRRTLNASSAPVRSAQTRNESVALDRWATLAGIKK